MNGATSVVGGVPVAYRANRKHRGYGVKSSLGDHNADHHRQLVGEVAVGQFVCKAWTSQPQQFKLNPLQQMPGLNI